MKRRDWERLIFRVFGVCLGVIFAAYISIGPRWICRSIGVLQGQEASAFIIASWQGSTLIITASPGSLYLVGGGRLETYIGAGAVSLSTVGTNADTTPVGRERIELRDWETGRVLTSAPIPPLILPTATPLPTPLPIDRRRAALPMVAKPAARTWQLYFPIAAQP